jgi:hypothetical protein
MQRTKLNPAENERIAVIVYNPISEDVDHLFKCIIPLLKEKGYFVSAHRVTGLEEPKLTIGTGKSPYIGIDTIDEAAESAPFKFPLR